MALGPLSHTLEVTLRGTLKDWDRDNSEALICVKADGPRAVHIYKIDVDQDRTGKADL